MRVSDILAALLVAPLVAAHGGVPGAPKIFGMAPNDVAALKTRNIFGGHAARHAHSAHDSPLRARQGGVNGRCGKNFGCATCAEGYCCSSSGYCGQGQDYCQAPDSDFDYGPGADANKLPAGGTTRNIARPKVGNVLYGGEGIYVCTKPGQIAITYDDGPYIYTNDLLDMFKSYNFKATFFVTGINLYKGSIDDESTAWPAVIRRMAAEGHQLASHTWSHQDLSAITKAQRYEQMVRLEMAMSNIIGKFPTYMRPPYSSCSAASGCQQDMADLGYHVSYFDLDTDDYNQITADKAQIPKDNVKAALDKANSASDEFLAIAHDIHFQTVHNLTGYMLDLMVKKGYKGVTMGECLGDAEANWYRSPTGRVATSSLFSPPACASTRASSSLASASVSASRTSSGVAATPTGVSVDSSCGASVGLTCLGFAQGECCSQYGWCGNTDGHCGDGCQKGFGKCGISSSSLLSSSAPATSSRASSASASLSGLASSSTLPSSVSQGSSTRASSSSAPSSVPSRTTSPDSTCGGTNGYTCVGFSEGECCSQYGYCGNSPGHCGTGCNPLFGKCTTSGASSSARPASSAISSSSNRPASSVAPSSSRLASSAPAVVPSSTRPASSSVAQSSRAPSSAPASSTPRPSSTIASSTRASSSSTRASSSSAPTPTGSKTLIGTCGPARGYHCIGFLFGECCSQFGFCGSSSLHCGSRCQSGYGKCN